eukprot:SAG31_NODE_83_length_27039_cov_14.035746_22_plen_535_part_00
MCPEEEQACNTQPCYEASSCDDACRAERAAIAEAKHGVPSPADRTTNIWGRKRNGNRALCVSDDQSDVSTVESQMACQAKALSDGHPYYAARCMGTAKSCKLYTLNKFQCQTYSTCLIQEKALRGRPWQIYYGDIRSSGAVDLLTDENPLYCNHPCISETGEQVFDPRNGAANPVCCMPGSTRGHKCITTKEEFNDACGFCSEEKKLSKEGKEIGAGCFYGGGTNILPSDPLPMVRTCADVKKLGLCGVKGIKSCGKSFLSPGGFPVSCGDGFTTERTEWLRNWPQQVPKDFAKACPVSCKDAEPCDEECRMRLAADPSVYTRPPYIPPLIEPSQRTAETTAEIRPYLRSCLSDKGCGYDNQASDGSGKWSTRHTPSSSYEAPLHEFFEETTIVPYYFDLDILFGDSGIGMMKGRPKGADGQTLPFTDIAEIISRKLVFQYAVDRYAQQTCIQFMEFPTYEAAVSFTNRNSKFTPAERERLNLPDAVRVSVCNVGSCSASSGSLNMGSCSTFRSKGSVRNAPRFSTKISLFQQL